MIEVWLQETWDDSLQSGGSIANFEDSEWWNLVELARRSGYEIPQLEVHYPRPFDKPVRLDDYETWDLYKGVSAIQEDELLPYQTTWDESNETISSGTVEIPGEPPEDATIIRETPHQHPEFHVGKTQLRRLLECFEIGPLLIVRRRNPRR